MSVNRNLILFAFFCSFFLCYGFQSQVTVASDNELNAGSLPDIKQYTPINLLVDNTTSTAQLLYVPVFMCGQLTSQQTLVS